MDHKRRQIKITSYVWNGAIIAYAAPPLTTKTSKFKLSSLRTTGILLWEGPESEESFLFNDVGNQPHEGVSQRHGGNRRPKDQKENVAARASWFPLGRRVYCENVEVALTRPRGEKHLAGDSESQGTE